MKSTSGMITTLLGGLLKLVPFAFAVALMEVGEVGAVTLNPGDILVVDESAFGGSGGIIRVDPTTGAQTTVSSGGTFVNPLGIAIAANGDLLVADPTAGGIVRVDPTTGAQTTVSSGGTFVNPFGIAIATNGDLLVADFNAFGGGEGIIKVNPVTGAQTTVSSGGSFVDPEGIAIAANGDILVADPSAFGGLGGIIRVDPTTGAQTTVSSGGSFVDPVGIAIAANGDILVADPEAFGGLGAIFRVNPLTGVQTTVSSGGSFADPIGIAIAANGDLLVAEPAGFGGTGGIIRVNPLTGAQTTVSSGGSFFDPFGIAIVPGPLSVPIDIKPGSFPNSINPRGKGTIPVAILTTDSFDAATVDPTTVLFGATGTEAAPVHSALEDVDGDGDTDLILHFNTQATGIQCGDTSASLTGETFDGQAVEGSDSVNTVGCK